MDDTRRVLASLQNIEDALVILVLDKLLSDRCLAEDRALETKASKSVTARLERLLGVKEG